MTWRALLTWPWAEDDWGAGGGKAAAGDKAGAEVAAIAPAGTGSGSAGSGLVVGLHTLIRPRLLSD
jgi:hypothetical protein